MADSSPNAYLRTKVMTASPGELRLMLIDGAIRFTEQARSGLEARDYEAVYVGVTRAQNIIMELINSLRPEHDETLCARLSGLYTFLYRRLIEASTQRDQGIIDEVLGLLRYERETWMQLLERLAQENRSAADTVDDTATAVAGSLSVQG